MTSTRSPLPRLLAFFTMTTALAAVTLAHAQAPAANAMPYADFQGKALVVLSDGDMEASAYVSGRLGDQEGPDALTVIPLDPGLARLEAKVLPGVSNSVAGPPTAIATTPDGRFAVIPESFGPRQGEMQRFSELPVGTRLTLVDLANPAQPRVGQTIDVGRRPEGVSISPKGDMVAVSLHPTDGRMLAFVPLENGRLGAPSYAPLPGVDKGVRVSHVEWHPSGEFVAATLVDQAGIRFARVNRTAQGVTLEPWGNPVLTSKYPFMGRFTPDGRHFLTSNLYWGPDVVGFWTEAPRGDVTSIRFATEPTPGANGAPASPRHFVVGRAETGISPEGIAISPDGTRVVTTNLEVSYAPRTDPRFTPYSSLTYIRLDPKTGRLDPVGTYAFDGILPEAATFDRSGRYVAVVNYDQIDPAVRGGSVDFWRVVDGADPKLVKLNRSIPVPHGPHSMALVN